MFWNVLFNWNKIKRYGNSLQQLELKSIINIIMYTIHSLVMNFSTLRQSLFVTFTTVFLTWYCSLVNILRQLSNIYGSLRCILVYWESADISSPTGGIDITLPLRSAWHRSRCRYLAGDNVHVSVSRAPHVRRASSCNIQLRTLSNELDPITGASDDPRQI